MLRVLSIVSPFTEFAFRSAIARMNYQIFAVIASAMKLPHAACRSFYRAVLRTGAQGRVYWFPARAGSPGELNDIDP